MKKKILIIVVALAAVVAVFLLRSYIPIQEILDFLESIGDNPYAFIIYIFVYAIAVTFALPASAFTLLAPTIFGFWQGLLVVVIASNIGCHLSYGIAKLLGKDVILKYVKSGSFIDKATQKAQKNGFVFMMYVRLIPLFPFAAVNYLSGIIGIKYHHYALATFFGMLPGSTVYVYFGYTASNVSENPLGLVVSISVLVVFTVVVTLISKSKNKKEEIEERVTEEK